LPRWPELLRRLCLAALLGSAAAAHAEPRPLWELGLGVGTLVFNDYRGSDTMHAYPVPVPYFIYRGQIFRSDRNGMRGQLFEESRIELNLSINGTTPVRNDSAREGMPDLRPTLELGPSLDVHLWRSTDARLKLDLRLPVRAAISIEASPRLVGLFAAPHLNLDIQRQSGAAGWKLGVLAGPLFADHRYDGYFYSVASQYATVARPEYQARGGYAGMQMLASLTRRFPGFWVGAYLRHDTLAGASFVDSPLVKRNSYWSGGIGVAFMITQSKQMVDSEE
jgi:MipA family protein